MEFDRIIKDIIKMKDLRMMSIYELRVSGSKAERTLKRIRWKFCIGVEARWYPGGIWICWKDAIKV